MGSILINGTPFIFEDIDLSASQPKVLDKQIAKENLMIYKKVLDTNGVKFVLMHGTLLGAIREHDFIDWDCDVDTYVYDEKALINIIPILYREGLKLCRYSDIEYSFIRKGIYIDAFITKQPKNILLRPFFYMYQHRLFPKKYFNNTQTVNFLGGNFDVPYNPENVLRYFYGKDWRVPKKGANSINGIRKLIKSFIPHL